MGIRNWIFCKLGTTDIAEYRSVPVKGELWRGDTQEGDIRKQMAFVVRRLNQSDMEKQVG